MKEMEQQKDKISGIIEEAKNYNSNPARTPSVHLRLSVFIGG